MTTISDQKIWGKGQFENSDIDAMKTLELIKLGNNYMHLILCNWRWGLSSVEKIEGWNVMDGGIYIYLNTREAFPGWALYVQIIVTVSLNTLII